MSHLLWVLWVTFTLSTGQVVHQPLESYQTKAECQLIAKYVKQEMAKVYPDDPGEYTCIEQGLKTGAQ